MRRLIMLVEGAAESLPATPENIAAAKSFVFGKWRERAQELGRDDPLDLSDACKFTSLFAATIFGGTMRGNFFHQWVELPDGHTLDLNDEAADVITMLRGEIPDDAKPYADEMRKKLPPSLYTRDDRHMRRRDNKQSMASVRPRVQQWADEFLKRKMTLGEAGGYDLPRHLRPWLTGRCFDFALALSERMPDAEFVTTGTEKYPDHVALRRNGKYYDARGEMDEQTFLRSHRPPGQEYEEIVPISRDTVELHAGVAGMMPPYKGNRDIAEARRAVREIFGRSK